MLLTLIFLVAAGLALAFVIKPSLGVLHGGRAFAFVGLFVLPLLVTTMGLSKHVEQSKRTEFCVSCHVMDLHGKSLLVDDDSLLAANHFQRGLVPRETACFSCHTTYTMYGDFAAKLNGLRHVYANYLGDRPKETDIKTYKKYHNRECLHCHEGTRKFEESKSHRLEAGYQGRIRRNEVSCLGKGCHEVVHDVANLGDLPLWKPPGDTPRKEEP